MGSGKKLCNGGRTYMHDVYGVSVVRFCAASEAGDDVAPHSGLSDSEGSASSTPRIGATMGGVAEPELPFYSYGKMSLAGFRGNADTLTRLFVGQAAYHLGPEEVAGLLRLLTGGRHACIVEKIVKWTDHRRPCGCFHVYVRAEDVDAFLAASDRALCDRDGVWVGQTPEQVAWLQRHCAQLKGNRNLRTPLLPYQLLTVSESKSTYRRSQLGVAPAANYAPASFSGCAAR